MSKGKNKRYRKLSREILIRYFLILIVGTLFFAFFVTTVKWLCGSLSFQRAGRIYRVLLFVDENLDIFEAAVIIIMWGIITRLCFIKPLKFLDELTDAAVKMSSGFSENSEIKLSPELHETELELNSARERSARNAQRAAQAEQRKNDLVVYLAHDLKTPLTSIIGYLTLLRDEPNISPENRARFTDIALNKADRLEQLVNEFFDITRFNLTTLTLERESVNLSFMLEQTVSEFLPIFAEKELAARTDIQSGIMLLCDPDKLARVFDNLLRNSFNYSYDKSEVFISLKSDGSFAEILVRNHGKNIPKEKLGRIFEQFFRVDSARSSGTGGAGLGLAIAKEIVDLHGGEISAGSENEIIEFKVKLPLDM